MDEVLAAEFARQVEGVRVGGWTVGSLIGSGKSAIVCGAHRDSENVAIKIFDRELVAKYGPERQLQRIQRELGLRNHGHKNVVNILDGGICASTGHHYVVMERLEAPTLESVILDLPRSSIRPVLSDIATAAQFLEGLDLVHRDIKPSNIAIDDERGAILLDLGVIRPHGYTDVTDGTDIHPFVGTLRYSSPEYLVRAEDSDVEGWRALTFYQIGAVLHDMIMRVPLFQDKTEPYARLVMAVQQVVPTIIASDVQSDLVLLARNCLIKDPKRRLELVAWDSFVHQDESLLDDVTVVKQRIRQRQALRKAGDLEEAGVDTTDRDAHRACGALAEELESHLRQICIDESVFPPVSVWIEPNPTGLGWQIDLVISASRESGLLEPLAVTLGLAVVDPGTRELRLDACAAIGSLRGEASNSEQLMTIASGILDFEVMVSPSEAFLYRAFERALVWSETETEGEREQVAGVVCWLTSEIGAEAGDE